MTVRRSMISEGSSPVNAQAVDLAGSPAHVSVLLGSHVEIQTIQSISCVARVGICSGSCLYVRAVHHEEQTVVSFSQSDTHLPIFSIRHNFKQRKYFPYSYPAQWLRTLQAALRSPFKFHSAVLERDEEGNEPTSSSCCGLEWRNYIRQHTVSHACMMRFNPVF
jgi:hypothetical protein